MIHVGDCLEVMRSLSADSIDAIVTDPPYHLTTGKPGGSGAASLNPNSPAGRARIGTGFMGKAWDGGDIAHRPEVWAEALRVAKPGAYLVAFGGTRTFHRLACAIEDAGWELRDTVLRMHEGTQTAEVPVEDCPWLLAWAFGSGFPKSLNLAGERLGWGTALKPAFEPIVLARKPLIGTVAANVEALGTGALNIDGCRVGAGPRPDADGPRGRRPRGMGEVGERRGDPLPNGPTYAEGEGGRWPANLMHDDSPRVVAGFPQSTSIGHAPAFDGGKGSLFKAGNGTGGLGERSGMAERKFDSGSASRFFYCPKASREDRNDGLENNHPTVKPTELMRWLCRLVTPPGGLVLDPFAGSGSTGRGAIAEGFRFVGIELSPEYAAIAEARIRAMQPGFSFGSAA